MPEYKQVILIRTDLKMSKGKTAAQAAHASVDACMRVIRQDNVLKTKVFDSWRRAGAKKIVLKVADDSELQRYKTSAERAGIKCSIVKDAGMTEIPPGTYTAVALGPDEEKKIDKIAGDLSAL